MADTPNGIPVVAGYVDFHAKTDSLADEIGEALGSASTQANAAGAQIGTQVENGAQSRVQGFGKRLLGWAGFAAIGSAVGGLLKSGLDTAMQQVDLERSLVANLGVTPQIAAEYADVAADMYAQGWGESLGEVGGSVQSMLSELGDVSQAELEELGPLLMGIAEQTGADIAQLSDATNKLVVTGLAGSATEAADIIAKAFQSFGESSGEDILDTVTEYSGQFQKLGIDAETAMGMVKQAMDAGARNTDFVADSLKEFSIRSIDQSKATMEAYAAIGVSGEEMTRRLAAGGPDAAAAMTEIFTAVNNIGDAATKEAVSVALFGTKAEDLGVALSAMDPATAAAGFGEFTGTAQEMADASMSLEDMLNGLGRTLTVAIADTIRPMLPTLREFMQGLTGVLGWLRDNPMVTTIILGIASALAVLAAGQWAFNAAAAANPVVLIIGAIIVVVGLLVAALATVTDGFTNWSNIGWAASMILVTGVNGVLHGVNGLIHAINGVARALEWVLSLGGLLGDWDWGNIGTIGLMDMPKLPGMADGGTVAKSGLSWVGEEGPELMHFNPGATIIPHDDSMALASGGGKQPANVTIINPVAEKGSQSLQRFRRAIGADIALA
ncbi:phage tail tape measure protein [uncultured Microbacterium sp.]|uniref:phage tail tape measure protein n=1 Tax=uncultured Microbacterium sp. TaxID=191216 RepID=UPI0028DBC8F0|nr:phage tail tape measure protein [uncultured Microbacterium sp.]